MNKVKMRADAHPADEHETDRVTCGGACAGHESEREVTANRGDRRHQNRAQSRPRGVRRRRRLYRGPVSCILLANSTIRIPFFAIRPTSVTRPTCE